LAIQLDTSREIYCAECRPIVLEEKKNGIYRGKKRIAPPPEGAIASQNPSLPFATSDQAVSLPPKKRQHRGGKKHKKHKPELALPGKPVIVRPGEVRDPITHLFAPSSSGTLSQGEPLQFD
jgi:hypothetical protein